LIALIKQYSQNEMEMFEAAIQAKAEEMEDGFAQQVDEFEDSWAKRLDEYDKDVEEAKAKQRENIEEERERYSQDLQQKLKISNKMSPKYLNLRKKIDGLSKAQLFEQAAELKLQMEDEERKCVEKHEIAINAKYDKLMDSFHIQTEKDLKRLDQKIDICRKQLLQKKESDFNVMQLKFKAQIKTFENKCGVERAQKRMFLEAFDPEKNVNVSKFYAQCIGESLKQEEEEVEGQEEQEEQIEEMG
jgi:hypothetical protein